MSLEERQIFSPASDLPRTPYPRLETILQDSEEDTTHSASPNVTSPEATGPASSSAPQTPDPTDLAIDDTTLSPAVLMKAMESFLEQVDWLKVANDVGEGTARIYRNAFEDILRSKIGRLRIQGKMYRSGARRSLGSSGNTSFIESDTDDYLSGEYHDETDGEDCEDSDEEDSERFEFCGYETEEGDDEDNE